MHPKGAVEVIEDGRAVEQLITEDDAVAMAMDMDMDTQVSAPMSDLEHELRHAIDARDNTIAALQQRIFALEMQIVDQMSAGIAQSRGQ